MELDNLSQKFSEKVNELEDEWNDWAKRAGVVPWESLTKNDNY